LRPAQGVSENKENGEYSSVTGGLQGFSHKILLWLQKQAEFSTFQLHARGAACSQYSTNRFGLSRFLQKMQQKAKHTGRDFCCRSRSWTF
jgi:hypothetical protein